MEALIRWNHPTRGLLSPDSFLQVAEKAGMAAAIARWVLNGACKQLAEWRSAEMDVPLVAVNVAMAQIMADKEFLHDVKDSLRQWNLQPSDLELDVTEFILAQATLARSSVLEELSRLGVCIAIDDFGAQIFVLWTTSEHIMSIASRYPNRPSRPLPTPPDRPCYEPSSGWPQSSDIEVVAEGVETAEQRAALIDISSQTKGQGFYFGPPLSAEDTSKLFVADCEASARQRLNRGSMLLNSPIVMGPGPLLPAPLTGLDGNMLGNTARGVPSILIAISQDPSDLLAREILAESGVECTTAVIDLARRRFRSNSPRHR